MAIFRFEKRGASNWWHWNGTTQILNFSNWEIVFDEVSQSVNLQQLNGANVPITQVPIADVRVKNLSGSDETFVTVELLRVRLVALGYNPLVTSGGGGSQNLAEVLDIGGRGIKEIDTTLGDYTLVTEDKTLALILVGNTEIDIIIPVSGFSSGDTIPIYNPNETANANFDLSLVSSFSDFNPLLPSYKAELICAEVESSIAWGISYESNGLAGGGGGVSNLSIVANPTNNVVSNSNGTGFTIPLADGTNAGLLKPAKFTVLENTSGTNTGDQDLSGLLVKANNLSDLTNTTTARTNLEVAKKTRIFLTADIPNNTVADIDITGFTFTLPPSTSCDFRVCLLFTSGAVSTGINVGVKITTAVGANGNVFGNAYTKTRLSATTTNPTPNQIDQGANATVSYASLTGVSTAGLTNASEINVELNNLATNTSVTVQMVFASEVGGSTIELKRGSSMVIEI